MSDILITYASSGIGTLFSQLRQHSNSHIEYLDPICTLLKLCVLNYKQIGTKIGIRNNTITIQEYNMFQNIFRTFHNDSRDQLYQLKMPILYFKGLESKIIENNFSEELLSYVKNIAVLGLNKLKITYEMDWKNCLIIRNCINDYIRILKNTYTKEQYENEMNDLLLNKTLMLSMYEEMLKLWGENDLNNIILIFKALENKCTSVTDVNLSNIIHYSNSVNSLIEAKDKELNSVRP